MSERSVAGHYIHILFSSYQRSNKCAAVMLYFLFLSCISLSTNETSDESHTLLFTSRPFLKTAGGIVLGSVAVSAVSADVLLYISVAIKASFLKLGMCNICKNNIAKMFLDF